MITTTEICNILIELCQQSGIITEVYPEYDVPNGAVYEERVVVIVKNQQPEPIWEKCFAELNFCIPDLDEKGTVNNPRIEAVERDCKQFFDDIVDCYDGSWYEVERSSIGVEEDRDMRVHFVNVRVLFKVLNVK